jgi:hypothetical protein
VLGLMTGRTEGIERRWTSRCSVLEHGVSPFWCCTVGLTWFQNKLKIDLRTVGDLSVARPVRFRLTMRSDNTMISSVVRAIVPWIMFDKKAPSYNVHDYCAVAGVYVHGVAQASWHVVACDMDIREQGLSDISGLGARRPQGIFNWRLASLVLYLG